MSNIRILTLEEVLEAQQGARPRGEYEVKVKDFFESGQLAQDFTDMFPGKESGNLRNNIKKYAAEYCKANSGNEYQIVTPPDTEDPDKKRVILINLNVYRLQAQNEES